MTHENSSRAFTEAQRFLAGGVASALRREIRPTPMFAVRGERAHLFDVDGKEYIDYTMAYGPLILGHAPHSVETAVRDACSRGSTFGAQHEGELQLAERLCRVLPGAELVCLSGSGTEAVMLALRIARAYTGRQKIIRFHGHYHGWSDGIYCLDSPMGDDRVSAQPATEGQSRAALADVVAIQWNDLAALEQALDRHRGRIAAVICEPVACNSGCIEPAPGYLEGVRELTRAHNCLLVFDEVITGFRLGLGGAQEHYGVTADLAVFGKALAAGLPLSAVTGRREILDLVADGTVYHLGTFNGNTIATAAAVASIDELSRDGGLHYVEMNATGDVLVAGLRAAAAEAGVRLVVNRSGPVFFTIFTDEPEVASYREFARRDIERGRQFAELMLAEGIYVRPNGLWYVSTAHTADDIAATLAACRRSLQEIGVASA